MTNTVVLKIVMAFVLIQNMLAFKTSVDGVCFHSLISVQNIKLYEAHSMIEGNQKHKLISSIWWKPI